MIEKEKDRVTKSAQCIDLTFLAWGDTHFGYDQRFRNSDIRWNIIEQMNNLAGWPYPEDIGSCVDNPDFVIHCGDIITQKFSGWQALTYYRYFIHKLNIPHFEVLGNHDLAPEFMNYFLAKYGAKSYSFEQKGIHCISLNSVYDKHEIGIIDKEDCNFLKRDLEKVDFETPIMIFTHSRIDRLKNGDSVLEILEGKRVILIVSAHFHYPEVFELNGISCIGIGHCRNHPTDPENGRSFNVIHIKNNTITTIPWRWDIKDWECGQRWGPEEVIPTFILKAKF